jgi:hypothetical protein
MKARRGEALPSPLAADRARGATRTAARLLLAALVCLTSLPAALAQQQQTPSSFGLDLLRGAIADDPNKAKRPPPSPPAGEPQAAGPHGQVTLVGLVTEDGARIDKGLVWRVFGARNADGKPRVTGTHREASPTLQLAPGEYLVNVAFGRANVTRRITVQPGAATTEPFMLNVGLLRVTALIGNNQPAPPNTVAFDVLSDDRDQFGQRLKVISGARPGRQFRLNSGVYQIVSLYGDANATVQADLTVEPGKLTEATVIHQASRVTFRLVRKAGGEAIADTQWSIINRQGDIVKESAGALPSHLLAPGTYTVSARSQGEVFRRTFAVRAGETTQIEVMAQ